MAKAKQEISAAHDDESQMIAARLVSLKAETKWDMPVSKSGKPLSGESLKSWLLDKEDQATQNAIERGIGYALLKRESGHGAFEGWLKDQGIPPRTAQQAMKTAQFLMELSNSNAQRAALLPQRKVDVLARLPAPVIDDMFNEGALDQADKLSRDDLQEIVRLRKEVETQGKKYDNLNKQVAKLRDESRKTKALPEEQLYIRSLRAAVLDETQQLNVLAHGLQQMLDSAALLPPDTPQAQLDSVAHPLMYSLQALYATATKLHDRAFEVFVDFKPDVDVLPPKLEPDEVEEAKRLSREFTDQMALRAKFRDADLGLTAKGKGK